MGFDSLGFETSPPPKSAIPSAVVDNEAGLARCFWIKFRRESVWGMVKTVLTPKMYCSSGVITGTWITGEATVGTDMNVNAIVAGTGITAIEVGAGLQAEAAAQVLIIAEKTEEANMMMRGVDEVRLIGGIVSPARRSPSPRRSPSLDKTPPSRGGSPDALVQKERSITPKSVSPRSEAGLKEWNVA
ncbi:hypothetical protein OROMI_005902 [Orobanche minor]